MTWSAPLLAAALLAGACARDAPSAAAAAAAQTPLPPPASASAPPSPRPPQHVGAAVCLSCHGKQRGWRHSWHARALARPTPETLVATFGADHFRGTSSEAWMERDGGRPVMRTTGADGALGAFPVDWLVGGKRMQDTITVLPDGRWQILPVYYHVTGRAWVDYNEEKQGPIAPDHPFFWANFRRTANRECLDCHATGVEVTWDEAAGTFATRFADAGVACEACHGPGARHVETMDRADIFSFAAAPPEAGLAVCASCHGPRNPLYPILDAAHRFQPGDRYGDRYQALVVVDGDQRSGEYFADGRPRSSSFEGQALAESRCGRVGGATCTTCHAAPHDARLPDELRAAGDETCRGCHAAVFAAGRAHTHHARAGCVACHMPPVVTGVLDTFADHALDVPAPENTLRHGVPSACGACHAHERQTPAELAAAEERLWPGVGARTARRLRLADAIDEKTADASEPALRAVLRDPDEAPLLRGAAALLFAQRFPAEAVAVLDPLLADPDPLLRARAIEAAGYARARGLADAVARAAEADPALPVRHMAVLVLGMLGDRRAAPAAARLVATPAGAFLPQPHFLLGLDAARRGDPLAARAALERTIALMPYHADARVALADLLTRAGELTGARRQLERALAFSPQHAAARQRLRALARPKE